MTVMTVTTTSPTSPETEAAFSITTSASSPSSLSTSPALSLATNGSNSFMPVLTASIAMRPGCVTRAVIRSTRISAGSGGRLPTCHSPFAGSYVPTSGDASTNSSPAGSCAVTTTSVAVLKGSRFPTLTKTVTSSPTRAASGWKVTSKPTSAMLKGMTVAEDESLPGFGSVVTVVTRASFFTAAPMRSDLTMKRDVIVRLSPGGIVPRSHGNGVAQSPMLKTKSNSGSAMSATVTPAAADGPALRTTRVKMGSLPNGPSSTSSLVTERSASGASWSVSVAVRLDVPPTPGVFWTVAVLTSVPVASALTVPVNWSVAVAPSGRFPTASSAPDPPTGAQLPAGATAHVQVAPVSPAGT